MKEVDFYVENKLYPLRKLFNPGSRKSQIAKVKELLKSDFDIQYLFIDLDKISTLEDIRQFDEREPGYFPGMEHAFYMMLESLDQDLSIEFIKQLHEFCTKGVKIERLKESDSGSFRHEDCGFWLTEDNTSVAGVIELIEQLCNGEENFSLHRYNVNTIKAILLDFENRTHRGSISEATSIREIAIRRLADFIVKNDYRFLTTQVFYYTYDSKTDTFSKIKREQPADKTIAKHINCIVEKFNKSIAKAEDSDRIIELSVELIQKLEQTHGFMDANCRTFVMLLFNWIMLKHYLPPCVFDNPNKFDAYSKSELADECKKGMSNLLQITMHQHCSQSLKQQEVHKPLPCVIFGR